MGISLFWNIIFVSALSLGFFLAIILFGQYIRTRQRSQLYLGAFTLVFSQILLNNFVYWHQAMGTYPHFIFSTISTPFILAPLFFMYCKTFLVPINYKKDWLHFLPFLLLTIAFVPIFIKSGAGKLELIRAFQKGNYPWWAYYTRHIRWGVSIHLIAYTTIIYFILNHFANKSETTITVDKQRQINWLYFLNSLILLYGILLLGYHILVAMNIGGIEKDYYISLVMCIAIYATAYIGMTNPDLLKGETFLQRIRNFKYSKTRLDEAYLKTTITRLEQLMETERIFLKSDIKLDNIATKTNIPRHHISQALNQCLGKTFHEFINQHRVEYACHLLQKQTTEMNIKTVMYESGFNNRASFNNNFKKFKGMTASEYLTQM